MHIPLEPVVLEGRCVRLEPLSRDHVDALAGVALDDDLWRWTPGRIATRADLAAYIDVALAGRAEGRMLPFVIRALDDGRLAGSTRYGNIDGPNRRVEIGWTWIGRLWQRTAVNTESKLLLLRHAFDVLGCLRVELKTDALNERSRRAIRRIGATEEGTLRKHVVTDGGRVRDTVYYSILEDEWPRVEAALEARLAR